MSALCLLPLVFPCLYAVSSDTQEIEAHPRPDWAHACMQLNGPWQFDFDPDDAGIQGKWFEQHDFSRAILVPFPWQSPLSGIQDTGYQGAAWYQREVIIPDTLDRRRVFLVFGAVDWQATVWVNGKQAAEHEGGYTPFEVELTPLVKPGETATITVRAYDATDPETPTGKQTGWYTPSGGIWQTVYLEYRGLSNVREGRITPDVDLERATFDCTVEAASAGAYTLAVQAVCKDRRFVAKQPVALKEGLNSVQVVLPLPSPALWTPDAPNLYDTRITLLRNGVVEDTVRTYFGMRKVSRGVYGDSPHECILLNNKPIYLRGALHQSFNPQGLYTHPDDAFLRNDYAQAKALGLNFVRIHIKVDEPRALYWADKLGIMLMCDMPNFTKNTPRARDLWEQTLRAAIARDFNHPAIIAWCDFNETWGIGDGGYGPDTQAWVRDMQQLTKQLDPTRLAEDNSPCRFDHVLTDINSWHFYIDNHEAAALHVDSVVSKTFPGSEFNYAKGWLQDTAPLINSEYGGVSAGSGDRDVSWVFLFLTNLLRKHDKICGYVYTELEDIEWEHNGFMNYDRSPKEFHYPADITLADLQGDEFPVLDCPPYQKVDARAHVNIPILLSHWTEHEGLKLRVFAAGNTVDGRPWSNYIAPIELDVTAAPYRVTPQGAFERDLPGATGILYLVAEVLQDGRRCAANYCVLDARDGAVWFDPDQFAVTFPVNKYSKYGFNEAALLSPEHPDKVFGFGTGFVEYRLRLPRNLKPENVTGCRLVAEIGAKADKERLDWPDRLNPADYPQTDGKAWPTDVAISLNGIPFNTAAIENDFADALGVLSHVANYQHGSRGTMVDAPLNEEALAGLKTALADDRIVTLRFEVSPDAPHVGGLSLYGADMGAYPGNPALVFAIEPDSKKPKHNAETLGTSAFGGFLGRIAAPRSAAPTRRVNRQTQGRPAGR